MTASPTPAEFDEAFGNVIRSRALNAIMRSGFPDLPDWIESYDFVPASGLDRIATHLRAGPAATILDLACGLGGPGLWIAERIGARLLGVDFSVVGAGHAASVAASRLPDRAMYVAAYGNLLPLRDAAVDAVVCIDALSFLPDLGLPELLRVTKSGGRVVITAWEADVSAGGRPAIPDFGAALERGGLRTVTVERHDEWLDGQGKIYEEAIRLVAAGCEEPAAAYLAEEGEQVFAERTTDRRVLVVAERP